MSERWLEASNGPILRRNASNDKMHNAIPYTYLHQPELRKNRYRVTDYAFCFFVVMLVLIFATGFLVVMYEIYYMKDEGGMPSRIRRPFPFGPIGMGMDLYAHNGYDNDYKDLVMEAQEQEN